MSRMSTPVPIPLPAASDARVRGGAAQGDKPGSTAWIPIRKLGAVHRKRIAAHLMALPQADRYLRFGHAASDEQIDRYVALIDFDRDEVFGIFNRRLRLIAVAHLAYTPAPQHAGQVPVAEFGVSVLAHARGRGFGRRLFDHATLHARNRGVEALFICALSENAPMLHLARSAGATVERTGADSEAWLKLPPDNLGTHVDEAFEEQAAAMDYGWKVQLTFAKRLFRKLSGVKARFSRSVRPAAS